VGDCFGKQERLAAAKQELNALALEARYFAQYYEESKSFRPSKKPRKGIKSATIMRSLQECEGFCERERPLSLLYKLKGAWIYGLFEQKFYQSDIGDIIINLQNLFYKTRIAELNQEIQGLQDALAQVDAKAKMDQLTSLSMVYLKATLYLRHGCKNSRPLFAMDSIWKQPFEILREYPIVLSTTFSSRSCLNNATYDYLIMDEASQVDVATGALALASAHNAVIVGLEAASQCDP